ncbi:UNVERIFIED_CONTAM: hypothetical protein HDU68_012790 [Siphonaria sp. JEL0065]|nr:hypothetical protein HDU68_012790 [Siphonaria sp. JEL0065]
MIQSVLLRLLATLALAQFACSVPVVRDDAIATTIVNWRGHIKDLKHEHKQWQPQPTTSPSVVFAPALPVPAPVPVVAIESQSPVPIANLFANSGSLGISVSDQAAQSSTVPPASSLPTSTIGALGGTAVVFVAVVGIAFYKRKTRTYTTEEPIEISTSDVIKQYQQDDEDEEQDVAQPLPPLHGLRMKRTLEALRRKRTLSQIFTFEQKEDFVPPTYLNADGMALKDGVVCEFADTIKVIYEEVVE